MNYSTFGALLKGLAADYGSDAVTLSDGQEEHDPSGWLCRLGENELQAPVGRDEDAPGGHFPPKRMLTLGYDGQDGRRFVVTWSPYRHGWSDTLNLGKAAHYYVPSAWLGAARKVRADVLVSLCGRANLSFRSVFKLSGNLEFCRLCKKRTDNWTETGQLMP